MHAGQPQVSGSCICMHHRAPAHSMLQLKLCKHAHLKTSKEADRSGIGYELCALRTTVQEGAGVRVCLDRDIHEYTTMLMVCIVWKRLVAKRTGPRSSRKTVNRTRSEVIRAAYPKPSEFMMARRRRAAMILRDA